MNNEEANQILRSLDEIDFRTVLIVKRPLTVIVQEQPWGVHYQIKAYPFDGRQEFQFVSDLTVRGKETLATVTSLAPAPPAVETDTGLLDW